MDYSKLSLEMHERHKGKLAVTSKVPITNKDELSTAYTPGVAEPCKEIAKDKEKVYRYTLKSNTIAVVTDGSAVLGLGNIGPEASIPVMEGKAILFKEFAGIDAFPIALTTQDADEIVETVKRIAPVFGGINLEDISAPRCFEIEERLRKELDIPVFHDDQHGTAIVVLAGLINALALAGKRPESVKVVINGAGAAGTANVRMLLKYGFKEIIVLDTAGTIYKGRKEHMNPEKEQLAELTNKGLVKGTLAEAIKGADVFIGLSAPNVLTPEMVKTMGRKAIIFAMANPIPEIDPDLAKQAGAFIVATGRSDHPNQINNVLAFPGVFKGLLKIRKQITYDMKIAAAEAIAGAVKPSIDAIIPSPFDKRVSTLVADAIIREDTKHSR